jgi:hypothetical protein
MQNSPSSSSMKIFLERETMRPDDEENEDTQTKQQTQAQIDGAKAIKAALLGLGMPSADQIVQEWRKVLFVRGKAKDLPRALYLLKRSVHKATEAGEPIVRPSESGRWLGLIIAEEETIQRKIQGVTVENSERERRKHEERNIKDFETQPNWLAMAAKLKALKAIGNWSDLLGKAIALGRVSTLIMHKAQVEAQDQGLNPEEWQGMIQAARSGIQSRQGRQIGQDG